MKKTLLSLFVVNLLLLLYCFIFGSEFCLVNIEIGFVTSSLVMLGSMLSYKRMVEGRLDVGAVPDDERDTLDKLEDPYDLYDEKEEDFSPKTLEEVVKEERQNLKKNRRSFLQTTKDSKASFSFYRLFAYGLLVMGFFYLNSNKLLDISSYLFSLVIPMVVIVFVLVEDQKKESNLD